MTTAETYDRYHRALWQAWWDRYRARLERAYPATGGIENYVHNWIVCDRSQPERAAQAEELMRANWAQWRQISDRGAREYDRTEHKTHGRTFRPLWCDYCKKGS